MAEIVILTWISWLLIAVIYVLERGNAQRKRQAEEIGEAVYNAVSTALIEDLHRRS